MNTAKGKKLKGRLDEKISTYKWIYSRWLLCYKTMQWPGPIFFFLHNPSSEERENLTENLKVRLFFFMYFTFITAIKKFKALLVQTFSNWKVPALKDKIWNFAYFYYTVVAVCPVDLNFFFFMYMEGLSVH